MVITHSAELLKPEEDFPAIHPEYDEPNNKQAASSDQRRLERFTQNSEKTGSKMPLEEIGQRIFERVAHQVKRQRVHANNDERKRPSPPLTHINDVVKRRENKEAATATEKSPRRRPQMLHNRANAAKMHGEANGNASYAGND